MKIIKKQQQQIIYRHMNDYIMNSQFCYQGSHVNFVSAWELRELKDTGET